MPRSGHGARLGLAAWFLVATTGCPSHHAETPAAPPSKVGPGVPTGGSRNLVIDTSGGVVASADGRLTVSVPAGAVTSPTDFTIVEITDTAPSGVGDAYRIGPAGTTFAAPIAITFMPGPGAPPLSTLTIAKYDSIAYWVRLPDAQIVRNSTAGTVATTVTTLGDFAVVGALSGLDLMGVFQVSSTIDPMSATGKSFLNFHSGDSASTYYLQWGWITGQPNSLTCNAPATPTIGLQPNVAEVHSAALDWGVSGNWDLTCSSSPAFGYVLFDTLGIGHPSCSRTASATNVVTSTKVQGDYALNCGTQGTATASLHFEQCNQGQICTSTNPCHTAAISCDTFLPVCVDNGNQPNGYSCGACAPGSCLVCGGGVCNTCRLGAACTPTNPCHVGKITCTTGFEVCTDTGTNVSNGSTCDTNGIPNDQVCFNGSCNVCYTGQACSTNPNPCVAGTTDCSLGYQRCVDTTTNIANGTACDTNGIANDQVCYNGSCNICYASQACTTNSNNCVAGVTSCSTGLQTCENSTTPIAAGIVCGANMVCNGTGTCIACTAGLACTTNPTSSCMFGVTYCGTGAQTCIDSTPKANGLACGTNMVCFGGACVSCTAGLACAGNPGVCYDGTTSCATGQSVCVNGTAKAPGTTCGTNLVCNGTGTCIACTAGLACSTNSNNCVAGVTSCSTGAQTCENTTTPILAGTSCGTNQVCNGAGTCIACTAGNACSTNPNNCVAGTTYCGTGALTCIDTTTIIPNGTTCGTNMVCNGGNCVSCTAGLACSTNPNNCLAGVTSCATGTSVCVDSATQIANGTTCGTNMVCNAGACVSCTAGLACATNPDTLCHDGTTSCATGTSVCVNGAAKANGTSCGSNLVCNAGACVSCTAGQACATNPDTLCHDGTTSCATGTSVCVDGTAKANGTVCGTNLVCNAGVCSACTAGLACTTNPDTLCHDGTTSCATGTSVCVNGAAKANGTTCGTNLVCDAGACVACTAGLACTTNPNQCVAGTTSCATGTSACVDTTTAKANGTSCGTNLVCNAGVCSACTAGVACTTNPDPACLNGVTSCATGTSVCVDGTAKANGTSCGTNLVCNGGVCTSCTAGLACSTNPNQCVAGTTSCATGTSVCVDSATPIPNGTTCGTNMVCNAGACVPCTAGTLCTTNPDTACHDGTTSCSTGTSVCVNGSAKPNGTACGTNLVCNAGACVSCPVGPCATNPNPCYLGTTSCPAGVPVCSDTTTPAPAGTACGTNLVCNGSGTCVACTAGLACTTNPGSACLAGVTSCATGAETCVDGTAKPNGTVCGTNLVCSAGSCVACTAGLACTTNPSSACLNGVTSCSTGSQTCVDGTAKPNGTVCGTNLVCSAGVCTPCTAGLACTTNPDTPCHDGTTSCSTGTSVCVDGTARPNGTVCGTNLVCNAGVCTSCTAGVACTTNPNPACLDGVTSCSTGASVCVDGTAKTNGTACGTNLVCNAGVCTSCTAGVACTTNPNPACLNGVTSCSTGTSVCADGTAKTNGTSCGTNLVCNAGVCVSCTAGLACSTNPDFCLNGITSCSTGTQACADNPLSPKANGTACGTNLVCSGGVCSPCTAGLACTTNPTSCLQGTTSCTTGAQTCVDTVTPVANGTSCGTNLVCNAGACVTCTAGLACTGNPDPCKAGVTSCATGTQTCVNSATNAPNGTSCGTNLVCNAGVCTSCTAGVACTTNPDTLCHDGTTSCATGTSVCVNGTAKPNGTACGTNLVCSAGACVACTAGVACTTNPDTLCHDGTTSCATGTSACVDGTARPNGTSCGTNLVCNGGACVSCTAGLACTTNPNAVCAAGVTSCSTGTSVCVDNTAVPNGTSCGTNQVCNGGVCVSCTAGVACSTNPNKCVAGATSCSTGTSVCLDTATPIAAGTSCGTNLVCNGAGTCVSCTAGGTCSTNPNKCVAGTTSCATGTSVCQDTATALTNGTSCGTNLVCSAGTCVSCVAGSACTPANACHVGTVSCTSGPACTDTGTSVADGTSCGTGQVCSAGTCVATRTVSGTRTATYWTEGAGCTTTTPCKTTVVAPDVAATALTPAHVQALVPNGAGGFTVYGASTSFSPTDGSYSIAGVPSGTFFLMLTDGAGIVRLVETTSSTVDLGYDVVGRQGLAQATLSTIVTMNLSGLQNWAGGNEIQIASGAADLWDVPPTGSILLDQTAGTVTEDWKAPAVGRPLDLLAATDPLYFFQLPAYTATDAALNAFAYSRVSNATAVSGIAMVDGTPATIAAALAAVTRTNTLAVDWRATQFEALLAQMGPSAAAVANPHELAIAAGPYAQLSPAPAGQGGSPQMLRMVRPAGTIDVTLGPALVYGEYLDATLWSEWRSATYTASVSYTAPGATSALPVPAAVTRRDPGWLPLPTPIVPSIGPVQSPTIAGAAALGPAALPATGLTPTIAWSAPAIGTATSLRVTIYELGVGPTLQTTSRLAATWLVAGTSVTVPSGILQAGKTYYAEIVAQVRTSDAFASAPERGPATYAAASTLTLPFSP